MDPSDIARCRLYNQQIARHNFNDVAELVSWLGASQAQDYQGAKWSLGLRLPGVSDSDIEKALAQKRIVRTWPLRHTLHFVNSKDVNWMLGLYPEEKIPKYMRDSGLAESSINEGKRLIIKAFRQKEQLERNELHRFMSKEGSAVFKNNFARAHVIRRAAREGIICYGPISGKQHTFVLLEDYLPGSKPMRRDRALAELAKRYFQSHGPATASDFAWWAGLKMGDARVGISGLGNQFTNEIVDGNEYFVPKRLPKADKNQEGAYILPGFDEYIVSYRDKSAFIDKKYMKVIYSNTTLVFAPTIIINGRVAGTWKRASENGKVSIATNPFGALGKKEKAAVEHAIGQYERFLAV